MQIDPFKNTIISNFHCKMGIHYAIDSLIHLYDFSLPLFSQQNDKTPDVCRRYGTKCNGCNQGISPSELVRKSRDNKVFHLNCLTCFICRRELSTGDQLYIVDDNKFMCKEDYLHHKHGQHSSYSGE